MAMLWRYHKNRTANVEPQVKAAVAPKVDPPKAETPKKEPAVVKAPAPVKADPTPVKQ